MRDASDLGWGRLGRAVQGARQQQHVTQAGLSRAVGLSLTSVQSLERGTPRAQVPYWAAVVEEALGWGPGSVLAVLEGGEPTQLWSGPTGPAQDRPGLVEVLDPLFALLDQAREGGAPDEVVAEARRAVLRAAEWLPRGAASHTGCHE